MSVLTGRPDARLLMRYRIDEALAGTEGTAFPDGKLIAGVLIRAFAGQYQRTEPHDVRTLKRLGRAASGSPLVDLVQAKDAAPEDELRLGLIALVALAALARTDADSPTGH